MHFCASDMQLYVDSDAAYLAILNSKSHIVNSFCCSNNSSTVLPKILLNGSIYVDCKVLRHIVTPAAEAETAGLFYNYQTAIHLHWMLNVLGHPQCSTTVKAENVTVFNMSLTQAKTNEANHGM